MSSSPGTMATSARSSPRRSSKQDTRRALPSVEEVQSVRDPELPGVLLERRVDGRGELLVLAVAAGTALFTRRVASRSRFTRWLTGRSLLTAAFCVVIGSAGIYRPSVVKTRKTRAVR
jgi:hypothetical protein